MWNERLPGDDLDLVWYQIFIYTLYMYIFDFHDCANVQRHDFRIKR